MKSQRNSCRELCARQRENGNASRGRLELRDIRLADSGTFDSSALRIRQARKVRATAFDR